MCYSPTTSAGNCPLFCGSITVLASVFTGLSQTVGQLVTTRLNIVLNVDPMQETEEGIVCRKDRRWIHA